MILNIRTIADNQLSKAQGAKGKRWRTEAEREKIVRCWLANGRVRMEMLEGEKRAAKWINGMGQELEDNKERREKYGDKENIYHHIRNKQIHDLKKGTRM